MEKIIAKTETFVQDAFVTHPHYSFNDWTIMYDHSIRVKDIAQEIAKHVPCDGTVLAIGALLHDIGKTYAAEDAMLHARHEDYNLVVSKKFLQDLHLPAAQLAQIKNLITQNGESLESKIIKDADTLAFFADKKLYTAFAAWAQKQVLRGELERKLKKYDHLNFACSKEIGKSWFEQIQKDWQPHIKKFLPLR